MDRTQIVKVGPSIIPLVSQRMAINRLAQIILQRDCVRFLPNASSIFIMRLNNSCIRSVAMILGFYRDHET
jgi:hypothetical protein